jgi:type IV pilus assembly protein PilE
MLKPRPRGFSLLEAMVGVALAAILATIALPSLRAQIDKTRRVDAITALYQAQLAEERWRANRPSYGTLAEIGVAAQSGSGHYAIEVTAVSATGYEILASARGVQQRDAACRHLRLAMAGSNLVHASGSDPAVTNPSDVNRRCWSL